MGAQTYNGNSVDTFRNGKEKYATFNGKSSSGMSYDEAKAAYDATTGSQNPEVQSANDIFARAMKRGEAETMAEEARAWQMETINEARGFSRNAAAQAENIDQYINTIGNIRTGLNTDYNTMLGRAAAYDPYIQDSNRLADTLWDRGVQQFNMGRGLMNMDGSNDPNSLAGRYEAWVRQIDPDRYVAMAGQDVQKSYDNALAQQVRDMGRAGYDASSTKTAEFRQRYAQSLAAALAGAKFRARQQGLSDMGKALSSALGMAEQIMGAGNELQQSSAAARAQAAQLEGAKTSTLSAATDIKKTQAALAQQEAALQAQKAQLYNNAASSMLGGAQAMIGVSQVDLGYYKADLDYQAAMAVTPQKKDNSAIWGSAIGAVGTIAGAAIGTMVAPGVGTAAGAAVGGAAGSAAGGAA